MDGSTSEATGFIGNEEDLAAFRALAASAIRTPERSAALEAWEAYKWNRQRAWVVQQTGEDLARYKGGHLRVLESPAIDLRGADLDGVCVGYVDLRGVRFDGASLRRAWLKGAKLNGASLRGVDLTEDARLIDAELRGADFTGARMAGADLSCAGLCETVLDGADLSGACLEQAMMMRTRLHGTKLTGARVYGIATWDLDVDDDPSLRQDLVITPDGQAPVVVDDLEVAQFTYLLLNNRRIRNVIDTIGRKGVLILGRFRPESRMAVLQAIRAELRRLGYLPMLFDFDRPADRTITETILTLAGMSRFVIADITNPSSSPLELKATMPNFRIPFAPIIAEGEKPFAMFADLESEHGEEWGGHLMPVRSYASVESLVRHLESEIVEPAVALAETLASRKGRRTVVQPLE